MIPFTIRKLYVDVVDEHGTVWIFYFVELECLRMRKNLAGVEAYPRIGEPAIRRALLPPEWPEDPRPSGPLRFTMELREGPVCFSGAAVLPPWAPRGGFSPLPLRWQVVAPRLEVTLRPPDAARVFGTGYADFVEIRGPPRALGLRHLRWGRIHGRDGTGVFTSLVPFGGRPVRHAALWNGGARPIEWDDFGVGAPPGGAPFQTATYEEPAARRVCCGQERTLREGHSVDAARFPGHGERAFYRWMMGPAREFRWIGSGELRGDEGSIRGEAIHEFVEFAPAFIDP